MTASQWKDRQSTAGFFGVNASPAHAVPVEVEVFWRPGCPYCSSLRRDLDRRGVQAIWRNIWQDEQARAQVRAVNDGNETVPTVRVGDEVLTNPSGARVAELSGVTGAAEPAATPWRAGRWLLSWLPVIALVALSELLSRSGRAEVSWGVDALAVAAWWLARPLRR